MEGVFKRKGLMDKLRKIFEDFAKQKGIDPLKPENWYPIPGIAFKAYKVFILLL